MGGRIRFLTMLGVGNSFEQKKRVLFASFALRDRLGVSGILDTTG